MDKLSDEMFVAQFQTGRQDAFDVLMARYKQRIYAYLLRSVKNYEDAEELTIEVFIKIYRALGNRELSSLPGFIKLLIIYLSTIIDLSLAAQPPI